MNQKNKNKKEALEASELMSWNIGTLTSCVLVAWIEMLLMVNCMQPSVAREDRGRNWLEARSLI